MTDYRSLLDAMEDVDRVIFAADGANNAEELDGLSNVLRSFQDTVCSCGLTRPQLGPYAAS